MQLPARSATQPTLEETKQTLKVRIWEHKQAVKQGEPKSALAVHAHQSPQHWLGQPRWREVNPWIHDPSEQLSVVLITESLQVGLGNVV